METEKPVRHPYCDWLMRLLESCDLLFRIFSRFSLRALKVSDGSSKGLRIGIMVIIYQIVGYVEERKDSV